MTCNNNDVKVIAIFSSAKQSTTRSGRHFAKKERFCPRRRPNGASQFTGHNANADYFSFSSPSSSRSWARTSSWSLRMTLGKCLGHMAATKFDVFYAASKLRLVATRQNSPKYLRIDCPRAVTVHSFCPSKNHREDQVMLFASHLSSFSVNCIFSSVFLSRRVRLGQRENHLPPLRALLLAVTSDVLPRLGFPPRAQSCFFQFDYTEQ